MTNEGAHPVSTHSSATAAELLGEILRPLVGLLCASGLTRAQVFEQLECAFADQPNAAASVGPVHLGSTQRDCMEIMCLWRRDRRFLTADGMPAALPITGAAKSFAMLCDASKAITAREELLETLASFGAVRLLPGGRVRPLTPTFLLASAAENKKIAADGVLKQLAGFMRVIDYNIRLPLEGGRSPRFERACTVVVAKELVPIFERSVRERGQEFIDSLDEWLERHREHVSESDQYVEIGAGAYFVDLGSILTSRA